MIAGHGTAALMRRKSVLVVVSAALIALMAPEFVRSFTPGPQEGIDFFQDWSSARNWREGLPVYTHLRVTAERYLGRTFSADEDLAVPVNAHPPTSILFTLPFAWLGYPEATTAWNVLSIIALALAVFLICRTLGYRLPGWWLAPALALALTCNPLRHQVQMGQINGALLALLVGMWVAERSGRLRTAGILLAVATTIKLTPGLFIGFYLLRRRWLLVAWTATAIVVLTASTAAIIGVESYQAYLREVLPMSSRYTPMRLNASLAGLWVKWFDAGVLSQLTLQQIARPIAYLPSLARVGFILSSLMVLYALAKRTLSAGSREQLDIATGMSVFAMLLLSPATWDHSFLLAILPLAVLLPHVIQDRGRRMACALLLTILWVSPSAWWNAMQAFSSNSSPVMVLAASLQGLALIGLFALAALARPAAGQKS
jgi:hypothetical protein